MTGNIEMAAWIIAAGLVLNGMFSGSSYRTLKHKFHRRDIIWLANIVKDSLRAERLSKATNGRQHEK